MADSTTNNFPPPETPSSKSDEGDRNPRHASDLPHSLALMPAGLEVVPANEYDIEVDQGEKELAQVEKEVVQAEKEVAWFGISPDGWHMPWRGPKMSKTLLGLRVPIFWGLLVSLLAIFALGIGLGVGLRVDLRRSGSPGNASIDAVPAAVCTVHCDKRKSI